jgi:hypothetical protein
MFASPSSISRGGDTSVVIHLVANGSYASAPAQTSIIYCSAGGHPTSIFPFRVKFLILLCDLCYRIAVFGSLP